MSSYLETRAYAIPHKAATVPILLPSSKRNRRIDKIIKMANLTIRNLTITPLELKEVERHEDPTKARKPNGLIKITSRLTGKSKTVSTADLNGAAKEPVTKQDITDVNIQPFSEHETSIPLPDASKGESLRLTFAEPGTPYTYSVDIPGPSPRSIVMKANQPESDREFTLIYVPHLSFLAIFSSAHLNRWMAELDPSYPLSALSIPGTHNSPTCYVALPSVRCQAVSVREQLDNGVRFLDVRVSCPSPSSRSPSPTKTASPPRASTPDSIPGAFPISPTTTQTDTQTQTPTRTDTNPPAPQPELSPQAPEQPVPAYKDKTKGPNLSLVHSAFPIALSGTKYFHDLLSECYAFLDANPSETVLMSVKREGTGRGTDQNLSTYLANRYLTSDRWYTKAEIPTLAEARGKMVLVRRFNVDPNLPEAYKGGMGIDGSVWPDNCADGTCGSGKIRIQDYYEVGQTQHIEKKIGFAREELMRAAQQTFVPQGMPGSEAAGGPLPLFINFLSGSNFFNASCWPEKIAAKINPSMIEYLCTGHGAPQKQPGETTVGDAGTGIVVTDWVGNNGDWDLIRCIVGWNSRLQWKP